MGEPSSIFSYLQGLTNYCIAAFRKIQHYFLVKKVEELEDLLLYFILYFAIVKDNLCISNIYYILLPLFLDISHTSKVLCVATNIAHKPNKQIILIRHVC
jgi:hypothetical protein